ncbi:MAG: HAMP domain-containing protein, partial [Gemmatimonadaceae bacterium]
MTILRFWSLRAKFLLLLLSGAVLPLVIVSFWLAGSASRSGEALLAQRLDGALNQVVSEAGMHWVDLRSEMLDIADDSMVQRLIEAPLSGRARLDVHVEALGRSRTLQSSLASPLLLESRAGNSWAVVDDIDDTNIRGVPPASSARGIAIIVPVHSRTNAVPPGILRSTLTLESLVPEGVGGAAAIGAILHLADRTTGASLSALPFDAALMTRDEFELAGERWIVMRRNLEEPAITIAAASPLGAYTVLFREAAQKGTIAILAVVLVVLAISALFTRRLTRSLENLASATHSVAAGDLERRVAEEGEDEVGRVGRAFNAMTESLSTTLRQLSQREALVAVGEFAAALAHEVRNPLTSIRIDLQRVEEKLPDDSPLRVQLDRALREVQRLDQTVTGALGVARSGSIASD